MDVLEIIETEARISQFTLLKLAEREMENGPRSLAFVRGIQVDFNNVENVSWHLLCEL